MTISGIERGTDLGQGLYSLASLRAYVALNGEPEDGGYVLDWLTGVLNPVGHSRWRPDYSFGDLISLFVVRELKKKGVKSGHIREAEAYLRKKWNTDRPFVSDEIKTDGCGIFVDDELVAGDQLESAERHGQQVMREAVKERLTHVRYDEGTASNWTPMRHILVDPRVQFGEPVIEGTRIPTESVLDMTSYADLDGIAKELSITVGQAKAAVSFEQRLSALQN